jgi:hypothetical protein
MVRDIDSPCRQADWGVCYGVSLAILRAPGFFAVILSRADREDARSERIARIDLSSEQ